MEDGEIFDSDEDVTIKNKNSKCSTPKKSENTKINSQYTKGVVLVRQGDQKVNSQPQPERLEIFLSI